MRIEENSYAAIMMMDSLDGMDAHQERRLRTGLMPETAEILAESSRLQASYYGRHGNAPMEHATYAHALYWSRRAPGGDIARLRLQERMADAVFASSQEARIRAAIGL